MNKFNKITKANSISISTFDFSTLSAKLLHNKLLRLENDLNNFCFEGGRNGNVTVSTYGARLVKDIKIK